MTTLHSLPDTIQLERVYGSLDAYATKGLGLTPSEIEALKAKFLAP